MDDDKQVAYNNAVVAQEKYWDALSELEAVLDINLDEFSGELSAYDVDSLVEEFS